MKNYAPSALLGTLALLSVGSALLPTTSQAAAGEIYVSNYTGGTINIATQGGVGKPVFASGNGLENPQGLAFDSSGNLYVADAGNNKIERYTPNGAHSIFAGSDAGLQGPFGLAFDSAGNLYVANHADSGDNIVRITPSGSHSIFADSSKGIAEPLGITFDSNDNLFVANEGFENILRITPEGTSSVFATTGTAGLEYPGDVAFSVSGDLYVVNNSQAGASILRFTPGGAGKVFAKKGLIDPQGLAFDAAGNLYVTDEQGFVQRFSASGADSSLFYQTGTGYPVGIAIGPTPKPAAVSLKATNPMAIEGEKPGTFVLSRPAGDNSAALPVFFSIKGTAKNGVNYKEIKSPVIIPAGAKNVKIVITAIGNASEHGTRTVTLKLLPRPADYSLGSPNKVTVSIVGKD